MADKHYHTTASTGEPMTGLSTERMLEVMDSLKRYEAGRETLLNLVVNPEEKAIKGLPPATEPTPALFGFPVRMADWIPEGYGMGQTTCGCSAAEIERDEGALMHMAKRHTVIVKFDA